MEADSLALKAAETVVGSDRLVWASAEDFYHL